MSGRIALDKLRRARGYVLILTFVASTLIESFVHRHAPPDVRWMSIAALSMYMLFEVGLFFARFGVRG